MRIGPLMASTAGRVEQLSNLPHASAAAAARLTALSDLLQRAGPPPRFFEDGRLETPLQRHTIIG